MLLLSISKNILLFVSGFGVTQALSLAALLIFNPKADRSVNRFLALYVCALTLPMLAPIVQHLFSWQAITFLEPLFTLIAPLLYLYVRSFKEEITWRKAWPHFIFFILSIPLAGVVYSVLGSKYPASPELPREVASRFLLYIPLGTRIIQRLIYYFLALRELRSYQRSILHLFSDTSRISLDWVKWLINGMLFLLIMSLVFYYVMISFPAYVDWWILIQSAIVSLYIYMSTFKGITQVTLWQAKPGMKKEEVEQKMHEVEAQPKAARPGPVNGKINEIVTRILHLMDADKMYKETELTLQDLADKLKYPSYQVSQAINEGLKKNFYDLVNSYRVEEAKRLLLDERSSNYTILSVGFEAGFNSKTTFNTVFKRITGHTPSTFRERQRQASPDEHQLIIK